MNPNLTAYYWAEQTNRQRLADHAARAWLTEEAVALRPPRYHAANACCAAGAGLLWLMSTLHRIPVPGAVRPLANQSGAPS
jgi:hypothetical protein